MAVSIKIVNPLPSNSQNREFLGALKIQEMLRESISSQVNGEIFILHNLTLTGQRVRDIDIVICGKLEHCNFQNFYNNAPKFRKKDLEVDNFCIVVELKEVSCEKVSLSGTHILIDYKGEQKDATEQNENQRYSFKSYLQNITGVDTYVSNIIWLKGLTSQELHNLSNAPLGALPNEFTFKELIGKAIEQGNVPNYLREKDSYYLTSNWDTSFLNKLKEVLFQEKRVPSEFTRKKLEILRQEQTKRFLQQGNIGEQMTIFRGQAGTGKTFTLLQTALQLANPETGTRCMLLTYNHALVSDIRRLLHYLDIPDDIDEYTIQVQTLHRFFTILMKTIGIDTTQIYSGYNFNEAEYNRRLRESEDFIREVMDAHDVKTLKDDNHYAIDWDYILIDEAQDWRIEEKNILIQVYGNDKLIVADGMHQFIRSQKQMKWNGTIERLTLCKRQKPNIVSFINALAEHMGVNWNMKCDNTLAGGTVIICKDYTPDLHEQIVNKCRKAQCENYDILLLVHQHLVTVNGNDRHFKDLESWAEKGIRLFDGTNPRKRGQYSIKVEESRLYQYDSCRGLEGWVVACLGFDTFLQQKQEEWKRNKHSDGLALESDAERLNKFLWQWTMMPMTRAIDTLVITLDNPNSDFGKTLKAISSNMPDIVIWGMD